jgi:hypothetical protein
MGTHPSGSKDHSPSSLPDALTPVHPAEVGPQALGLPGLLESLKETLRWQSLVTVLWGASPLVPEQRTRSPKPVLNRAAQSWDTWLLDGVGSPETLHINILGGMSDFQS